MSGEKQEAIDDIVREMRKLGELDEKSTDRITRSLMGLGLRTYADRLEAAAKREGAQHGNSAAMREALDKAHRVLHCAIIAGILKGDNAYDAMNMAAAALAKPPRNCDAGTAEEQLERFNAYCDQRICEHCELPPKGCRFAWSQMPYEEGCGRLK